MPVFLHFQMNLSWTLFDVSDNALGGVIANVFRAVTIALTIFITIRHHKAKGLQIGKHNLWVHTAELAPAQRLNESR